MKAILISLMVIGLVGGMIGGGMFAYFSDTETSTGNTFTAGTIDIELTTDQKVWMNGTSDDFKPCEVGWLTKTVKNVGQNPADVYKQVVSLIGSQGTSSEPELEVEDPDGIGPLPLVPILPMPEDFKFDLTVTKLDANGLPVGTPVVMAERPLTPLLGGYIFLGTLAPGESFKTEQSLHLIDTLVPQNGLQGDIATVVENFVAYQVPGDSAPSPIITIP